VEEYKLVRFAAHVPERDKDLDGVLRMHIEKDGATDTYLGFVPALKLYSQGRTQQEAERLMEKCVSLYLATAVREGQFGDILLARGFRRIPAGSVKPVEIISIRSISGERQTGPDESGMELEFAGAK